MRLHYCMNYLKVSQRALGIILIGPDSKSYPQIINLVVIYQQCKGKFQIQIRNKRSFHFSFLTACKIVGEKERPKKNYA